MLLKQKEYKDNAEDTAKASVRATQHRIYEAGDKAGKLLVWLDKREIAEGGLPR